MCVACGVSSGNQFGHVCDSSEDDVYSVCHVSFTGSAAAQTQLVLSSSFFLFFPLLSSFILFIIFFPSS